MQLCLTFFDRHWGFLLRPRQRTHVLRRAHTARFRSCPMRSSSRTSTTWKCGSLPERSECRDVEVPQPSSNECVVSQASHHDDHRDARNARNAHQKPIAGRMALRHWVNRVADTNLGADRFRAPARRALLQRQPVFADLGPSDPVDRYPSYRLKVVAVAAPSG